ncbi:putative ubiquitinyl hydrolase 1 [Microsporum audouinii]
MSEEAGGWSTIESDEGVFTALVENLGVQDVQFEELVSLDADTIRSLSPVYGVIFLFKWISGQSRSTSSPQDGEFDPLAVENGLFFAAQTIQNACGTQAVLSVILNQDKPSTSASGIDIGSELRSFKEFTTGFPPDLRGETLSNSARIRNAHNLFARSSPFVDETSRPPPSEEDSELYHFIAYLPFNGKLYELDGLQPHPITHGLCSSEEFPEKVIEVLQRRIGRYPEGEIRFNLMAVVRDLRISAQEIGDEEMLDREKRKRANWAWENSLRKCNFIDFTGQLLKGVVDMKLKQGAEEYDKWIEDAKKASSKRAEMRGINRPR